MRNARLLVRALRDPASVGDCDWAGLISAARAEQLIGSLAFRMEGRTVPAAGRRDLRGRPARCRAGAHPGALGGRDGPPRAGAARRAGDPAQGHRLPRRRSRRRASAAASAISTSWCRAPASTTVEAALIDAGWERVKEADGYDDVYYRRWMHELPPLIHRTRDRMIDVHHTILPLTARPTPDAAALIADSVDAGERPAHPLAGRHRSSTPPRICSPTATSPAGLRNLWDIDRLLREFAARSRFLADAGRARAAVTSCGRAVARALRLAGAALRHAGRPLRSPAAARLADRLFEARLLARNGWGQETAQAAPLRLLPPLALAADAAADAGAASVDEGAPPA